MKIGQPLVIAMAAFLGGIVGGVLSDQLLSGGTVHAQKANGVNAEEFLLLDQAGKARAGLGLDAHGEVGLVLTSKDGSRTLTLSADDPRAIKLTFAASANFGVVVGWIWRPGYTAIIWLTCRCWLFGSSTSSIHSWS